MSKKGIPTASMMMMMMMTTCFSWETSLVLKRHHDTLLGAGRHLPLMQIESGVELDGLRTASERAGTG